MNFWIDRTSESNNVIVATEAAIFVGSCDESACDVVQQHLSAERDPLEVLGAGDLMSIPYHQVQRLVSRSTDKDVSIDYRAKKELEHELLFFESVECKQAFVDCVAAMLPANLARHEFRQSVAGAALGPLASLAVSLVAGYLFINKFRWLTFAVAGLWAAGSLYVLVSRAAAPPTVTRWTVDGRYVRKIWQGLKTAGSIAIVALVAIVSSENFPDSWGRKSIYDHVQNESLDAASVQTYLERGADIDYRDGNGDTPLAIALDWGRDDIAIALIDAGADLELKSSYGLTPLEYAVTYGVDLRVTRAMLRNGADLDIEVDGMTPLEYAREHELEALEAFLIERDQMQSSATSF